MTDLSTRPRRLRLWPGVVIVVLQWLSWLVVPIVLPEAAVFGALAKVGGLLPLVVWWVFFSRAPWSERLGAIVLMIVALVATPRFLDESIATGNMGFQFFAYVAPALSLALVAWAVVSRRLPTGMRWAAMVGAILIASGVWTLLRSEGMTGHGAPDFKWRWAPTAEQRLLARAGDEPAALAPAPAPAPAAAQTETDWPGFRGPDRNGTAPGVRIETDWSMSPPVELWRRAVGPGVSSIAAKGDLLYTQEQRGDDEIVASYRVATGEPVWRHSDPVRFWDSHVGAGPRATPALADGRVYTLGATGILNALDAASGAVVWSRNALSDMSATVPTFALTSSPLVVDDVVIVAVSGQLAAYDLASGEPRWLGPGGGSVYSSPHLLTIGGVAQVLLGARSVSPADGTLLWERPELGTYLQPALTADGDLLFSVVDFFPSGLSRIAVGHGPGGWTLEDRWTSSGLKPHFNDIVVHEGHAYGFDGSILACLDLETGERRWKGGRYGHGQLLVLPDQDVLLVLSERGEVVLVAASPDGFTELARWPAIQGRTWNHPALVGNVLLVRNSEEMAALSLALQIPVEESRQH